MENDENETGRAVAVRTKDGDRWFVTHHERLAAERDLLDAEVKLQRAEIERVTKERDEARADLAELTDPSHSISEDPLDELASALRDLADWRSQPCGTWVNFEEGGWAAVGPHRRVEEEGNDEPGSESHALACRDAEAIRIVLRIAPAIIVETRRLREGVRDVARETARLVSDHVLEEYREHGDPGEVDYDTVHQIADEQVESLLGGATSAARPLALAEAHEAGQREMRATVLAALEPFAHTNDDGEHRVVVAVRDALGARDEETGS
jgi:hypothetical protein